MSPDISRASIKESLLNQCRFYIEERVGVAQNAINRAKEGAENETKSSVGDKYETTRALLQTEQDNQSRQLSESLKLQMLLGRIDADVEHEQATFGSVISTDQGNYFISISAGRLMVEGTKYFAISPQTPLAREFLQKKAGETATFNDKPIRILDVF